VHESSFEKFRAFRNAYLDGSERVLEVGSRTGSPTLTLRELFLPPFQYVGLDIEPGKNVDIVVADPYQWSELATESFDVVISNQTFEHIAYPWITMAEMARVATPGGLVAVQTPSEGHLHRYPLDCWRFYPDAWRALCTYVGLDLVERYRERWSWRKTIPGPYWRDSQMIARKPKLDDSSRDAFYLRLDSIVSTRTGFPKKVSGPRGVRPSEELYERAHELPLTRVIWRPHNIAQLATFWVRRFERTRWVKAALFRIRAHDGRQALRRGDHEMPFRSPAESTVAEVKAIPAEGRP
jgi:SAM-dependent methyltransferase